VHLPLITIPQAFIIIPSLLFTFRVHAFYLALADSAAKSVLNPRLIFSVSERHDTKGFKIGAVSQKQDIILIKFLFLIRHDDYNVLILEDYDHVM